MRGEIRLLTHDESHATPSPPLLLQRVQNVILKEDVFVFVESVWN